MKSKKLKIGRSIIIIDPSMPYHGDDPVVIRKAERFKALLMKCKLPGMPPQEEIKNSAKESE
jgi:hypothetical protein